MTCDSTTRPQPAASIPPPPPGWAIVPADDARLDCLPVIPLVYNTVEPDGWTESVRLEGSRVSVAEKERCRYALPIEPAQPWSLPAPPAGQAWHRQDWEAAMLPDGYRPLLLGELPQVGDEVGGTTLWVPQNRQQLTVPAEQGAVHQRTRRPLPASQPDANALFTDPITWEYQATIDGKTNQVKGSVGSQPEQASPAEPLPPLAFVTYEDGSSRYIYRAAQSIGETYVKLEWRREPTVEERYIIQPQVIPASPVEPSWQTLMAEAKAKEAVSQANNPLFSGIASMAENDVVFWQNHAKPIIGTDPKGEAGKAKPPLALLPPEALRQAAFVHGLGAEKYGGPFNWRNNNVTAATYVAAMMRHIGQYLDGEDADAESGLSHLAHVIASANILIDAKHCGTLVDDRPKRPA